MPATLLDYPPAMPTPAVPMKPSGLALLLGWPRLRFTLLITLLFGWFVGTLWSGETWVAMYRIVLLGFAGMLVFGVLEQWPRRLPSWCARWVLQVMAVAAAMPLCTYWIYVLSTVDGAPPFWRETDRIGGFFMFSVLGLLIAPWIALAALVRQKDALARHQALVFDLQRSELERQALDARLRLLQAQVAPHFLFNTLANVQALVEAGAQQAPAVLRSLIAYLRAAVPRLHEPATTLAQEIDLVQAYLELMHMRIPDRLQFSLQVDDAARHLQCPPMTMLTLVENAVRHGIDPSEEGGRIDVGVQHRGTRCVVRVADTGLGLPGANPGLGTGLAALRERLALVFAGDVQLQLTALSPHGTAVQLEFPALQALS